MWWEWDDPVASKASLADCRKRGVGVGLKMNGAGAAVADEMHQALTDHGFGSTTGPTSCGAMFDAEMHNSLPIVQLLQRWRQLRPTRYTVWTLESFQGGVWTWISPQLIQVVNADPNLLVCVQEYGTVAGDQLYPFMGAAARDELERLGFLRERLTSFIGVKSGVQVPYGWEGVLYGFHGLPSSPPAAL